jgi:probable addiction module antidote protein
MNKKREHRDFNELLKDRLKNSELAIAYLNEALSNEDKKVFLLALRDVIEARGDITSFAQAADMPRQSIYRILSEEGNPTLDKLLAIFHAIGARIELKPA